MTPSPSLWRRPGRKILASKSAARLALLESAALPMEAIPAAIDERAIEGAYLAAGGRAAGLAQALAQEKALDVSRRSPGALVIGADQTLSVGETLFHKAATRAEAAEALRRLSGRRHRLTSAVAAAEDGAILFAFADVADLTMRRLAPAALARYLDLAGEAALQSVGGYQFEGLGAHLFSRVLGAHSTVLGLPLLPLLARLRDRDMIGP